MESLLAAHDQAGNFIEDSVSELPRAYAHLLSNLGRHEEAPAEAKRARELDPLTLEGSILVLRRTRRRSDFKTQKDS